MNRKVSIEKWNVIDCQEALHNTKEFKAVQEAKEMLFVEEKKKTELEESIKNDMIKAWLKSLDFELQKVTVKRNPDKLVVTNEEVIPEQYKIPKTTVSIDKKAIKADLKKGNDINGVEITNTYSLVVTPK